MNKKIDKRDDGTLNGNLSETEKETQKGMEARMDGPGPEGKRHGIKRKQRRKLKCALFPMRTFKN